MRIDSGERTATAGMGHEGMPAAAVTSRPHSRSVSGRTCLVNEIKVEVGQIFSIEESELTSAACSTQSKAK
jgi:hypothetical protein